MTVTLVSGKTEEFDSVWVKFPIMDLSEEHQKVVIKKIKREAGINDDWRIPSNYYVAGGRRWVPGDVEDKQFTIKDGKSTLDHKKLVDYTLIIHRDEAERILKTLNRPIVWVDDTEIINRRYWIAANYPVKLADNPYHYHQWSRLDAHSIIDSEGYEIDVKTQGLVHDFYIHGGMGGTLEYYNKRLSEIMIPQFAEFCKEKAESEFTKFFFKDAPPEDPGYLRKRYIELVRSMVHEFDHLEESWEFMSKSWASMWRIVHIPVEDQEPVEDNTYYSKSVPKIPDIDQIKTGEDLREWLKSNFITQDKAAELCGVQGRTFRRWVAGKPPIPKGMLELLKTKIQGK